MRACEKGSAVLVERTFQVFISALFTLSFTDKGTTDLAVSADGSYLYADTGAAGIVDLFSINSDGTLNPLTPVVVPGGANLEGIVAT